MSAEDTSPLLGYLIVDLANMDKTGKVNINQLYDIDSTVPYNTNINNYDIDQLKNGILTFRPLFYKSKDNNIISLHYDKKTDSNFYKRITHLDSASLSIKQYDDANNYGIESTLERDTDYIYYKDNIRLTENVTIDSNFNNMLHNYLIVIPNDGIISKNIDDDGTASIILNYIYCDTNVNSNVYYLNNYIKPFSYDISDDNNLISDPVLGNTYNNKYLCKICFVTNEITIISNKQIILSKNDYTFLSSTTTNLTFKVNNTDKQITLENTTCNNGNICIEDINNEYKINNFNNIVDKSGNILFEYKTYELINLRINPSVIYINPNTNNLHTRIVNTTVGINDINSKITSQSYLIIKNHNIDIYRINNLFITDGNINKDTTNNYTFNPNIYKIITNNNNYENVYENHPIIYNNEYKYSKELLIPNDNTTFKYTLFGVIYNNTRYIFSAKDVSLNIYGQIVVNTDKYYYKSNEKAIYSINGDNKIVSSSLIMYNEYIEILNSNYFSIFHTKGVQGEQQRYKCLCKYTDISTDNNNFETLGNNIIKIINPIYGTNSYIESNIKTNSHNVLFDSIYIEPINDNQSVSISNNKINLLLSNLKNLITENNTTVEKGKAIITNEGIITLNPDSFIMNITNYNDFIYSDNHIDIPFFETPIEKDMKIVLKPISKYSILSYNNKSYTNQAYTLAKNVGFKISLCNIYVTLTSYIGEYPSMIN